ncbi:MAG TPA: DUF4349 domain-containing protein [Thermoanaerobaculia bacterium]|jgi:hypothetical protein|nr:DUF4349 domain-containing protein [Thermoanaerobaculia bacterium]
MRKWMLALLLVAVACKKQENRIASAQAAAPPPPSAVVATAEVAGDQAINGPSSTTGNLQPMIVRTATLTIVVADTGKTLDKIASLVEQNGGYVSGSNIWRETEQLRAKLTLRVPSTTLRATLAAIRASGIRVQSETMSSDEVTQEYVDLGSQLKNLEATEVELRQLMTAIREHSKKASEVLEMSQQLTSVRGQIEQARGRMRYLQQMTSYATVNVELVPDAVAKPVVEPGWQPVAVAKDAARALTNVMKELASAAIWLLVYALPLFVLLGIAAFIAWKLLRRLTGAARTA